MVGFRLRRTGFTLIEIIIVLTILAILLVFMAGIINPGAMINRAQDAQRKKDIRRIKIAFEEYYNDKSCYPTAAEIAALACKSSTFRPYLDSWPCDPKTNVPYIIGTENSDCPHLFRILTNLRNLSDPEIPANWYQRVTNPTFGDGTVTKNEVNFGVSSSNVKWYDMVLDPSCYSAFRQCYKAVGAGCQSLPLESQHLNASVNENCTPGCTLDCCYMGNVCN